MLFSAQRAYNLFLAESGPEKKFVCVSLCGSVAKNKKSQILFDRGANNKYEYRRYHIQN